RDVWSMEVPSENREVYRAEYLAWQMLREVRAVSREATPSATEGLASTLALPDGSRLSDDNLLAAVQTFMGPRYAEGYTKGVHDHDAAIILRALLEIDAGCGLLRYSSRARAMAGMFWHYFGTSGDKKLRAARLAGFGTIAELFPGTAQQLEYTRQLRAMLEEFAQTSGLFADADASLVDEAATYLFHELSRTDAGTAATSRAADTHSFAIAKAAADLH